jgi:Dolichyl-phosphate-mannose-protein mannosyltransferase
MSEIGLVSGLELFAVLAVFGSLALLTTRNHQTTVRSQINLFLAAFALRFAFSICVYQFGLVQILGDEDSSGWFFGIPLWRQWMHQRLSLLELPFVLTGAFGGQHLGYRYLLAALFYVTDSPTRMAAAALNCFFGALTVVMVYRIARELFSEWVAVRVGWWTCLMPSLVVWAAQTVKEPVVILLETIALYGCVALKRRGFSLRHVSLCVAAPVLVIPFRFYVAYIAAASILLSLLLPHITSRRFSLGSALAVAGLIVPLLVFSGSLIRDEAKLDQFDLKFITAYRHSLALAAGSGVETSEDLQTTRGLVLATIVGGAHLLFAPFPWQLTGSLRKILTMPELFVWWWLVLTGLIPGFVYVLKKRFNDVQPLFFFILGLTLLYSVTFGNIGLAYRQRAQLLPWLLIIAVVGLERKAVCQMVRGRTSSAIHQFGPRQLGWQQSNMSVGSWGSSE